MCAGAGIAFVRRYPLAAGRLVAELQGVLDDELGADLADGSIRDRRGQTEAVSPRPWFFD